MLTIFGQKGPIPLLLSPIFATCLILVGLFRSYQSGGISIRGGFKVLAVLGEEGVEGAVGSGLERKSSSKVWEAIFDVDNPGPRSMQAKGEVLDANQALEVVRFDIQYCDWRARRDLMAIMHLHGKVNCWLITPFTCST